MLLPGRHANTSDYRYGFQGQELDNEVKGEGNSLNYKFRMHDPRVGRFFAVDPLFKTYPWNSPYVFAENRVIDMLDIEGLEIGLPDLLRAKFSPAENKPVLLQVYDGVILASYNAAEGVVWTVENPKKALKGIGNFGLGLTTYNSPTPMHSQFAQQYLDEALGTSTKATMGAFEASVADGADKFVNGSAQDRSEIVSGVVIGIMAERGMNYVIKVGKLALIKNFNTVKWPKITNKVRNDVQTNPEYGPRRYYSDVVEIKDGRIQVNGKDFTGVKEYIVTSKGELKLGKGHDYLSGNAEEVAGAGKLYIEKGKIVDMTNETGHFRPTMDEMKQTLKGLDEAGLVDPKLKEPTDLYGN